MPDDVGEFQMDVPWSALFDIDAQNANWAERHEHIGSIGFVRITPDVVGALVDHGPWLEVGAGTGALAKAICKAGGRVVATDDFSWSETFTVGGAHKVWKCNAQRAGKWLRRKCTLGLLLAWPCYDEPMAFDAAVPMTVGQRLAYIGERSGGCTGDAAFHDLLARDFEAISRHAVAQFSGLHDQLTIYRRVRADIERREDVQDA